MQPGVRQLSCGFHNNPELLKYQISSICLNFTGYLNYRPERNDYFLSNLLNLILLQLNKKGDPYDVARDHFKLFRSCLESEEVYYASSDKSGGGLSREYWLSTVRCKIRVPVYLPELISEQKSFIDSLEKLIQDFCNIPRESIHPTNVFHQINKITGHEKIPSIIILDPRAQSLRGNLPQEFIRDPQNYLSQAEKITCNNGDPSTLGRIFDPTIPCFSSSALLMPNESKDKVLIIPLINGGRIFCKRINPLRVRYPEEEIEVAEEVKGKFTEINSSQDEVRLEAQDFVGIVYDGLGAFYLLSKEIIHDRSLQGNDEKLSDIVEAALRQVPRIPDPDGLPRLRDCLYKGAAGKPTVTVIDFETLPKYEELKRLNMVG